MADVITRWLEEEEFYVSRKNVNRHLLRLAEYVIIPTQPGVRDLSRGLGAKVNGGNLLFKENISAKEFVDLLGRGRSGWRWIAKGLIPSTVTGRHRYLETRLAVLTYFSIEELQGPYNTAKKLNIRPESLVRYLDDHPEVPHGPHPFGLGRVSDHYVWSQVITDILQPTFGSRHLSPK